jgi:ABC-2 type transport system ATP-binding protein
MRMLLGLVSPTSGSATIAGSPYAALSSPISHVGAVLEANSFHPGRTAVNHLRMIADAASIDRARCDAVLDEVGLAEVADRRVGGFSLGMRQRLGLATALLAEPAVLLLDEPTNGLDPEGVHWLRAFLRRSSAEGRTVFVSSHLLSEVALTVDDVVVIDNGHLVVHCPVSELADRAGSGVRVRTPMAAELAVHLAKKGLTAEIEGLDRVVVHACTPEQIGAVIADAGIIVYEMSLAGASLEDAFLELTSQTKEPTQ